MQPALPPIIPPPIIPLSSPPRAAQGVAAPGGGAAVHCRETRKSGQRPLAGLYLLTSALVLTAYYLRFPPEGTSLWLLLLCTAAPCALAGIGSLTGNLRPLWLLMSLLVAGAGIFIFAAYSVPNARKVFLAQSWPATECAIVFSAVIDESPVVRYRYTVDGRVYEADTIDFLLAPGTSGGTPEEIVRRYPADHSGICFYNPKNPAEAVLRRGWRSEHLAALSPLILVAVGAVFLFAAVYRHSASPVARERMLRILADRGCV